MRKLSASSCRPSCCRRRPSCCCRRPCCCCRPSCCCRRTSCFRTCFRRTSCFRTCFRWTCPFRPCCRRTSCCWICPFRPSCCWTCPFRPCCRRTCPFRPFLLLDLPLPPLPFPPFLAPDLPFPALPPALPPLPPGPALPALEPGRRPTPAGRRRGQTSRLALADCGAALEGHGVGARVLGDLVHEVRVVARLRGELRVDKALESRVVAVLGHHGQLAQHAGHRLVGLGRLCGGHCAVAHLDARREHDQAREDPGPGVGLCFGVALHPNTEHTRDAGDDDAGESNDQSEIPS